MANPLSPATIKKYVTVPNLLIVGGALGLLYYISTGGKMKLLPGPSSETDVDYTVTPLQLTPGAPGSITVTGAFTDAVDQGYYYVSDSNLIPITHGSLGKGITTFNKSIMLPPLPLGQYNISVTDTPIDPLRGGTDLPTKGGDQ